MGLDDRLRGRGTDLITRMDQVGIHTARPIGIAYQHVTGQSYKSLVQSCRNISQMGYGVSALMFSIPSAMWAYFNYESMSAPKYDTQLIEEMKLESRGMHRHASKMYRLATVAMIAPMTHMGVECLQAAASAEHASAVAIGAILGGRGLLFGISSLPYMLAEYLSLADMPPPPHKTIFQRFADTMKVDVTGAQPALQPIRSLVQ